MGKFTKKLANKSQRFAERTERFSKKSPEELKRDFTRKHPRFVNTLERGYEQGKMFGSKFSGLRNEFIEIKKEIKKGGKKKTRFGEFYSRSEYL